ncbi:MAG: hypothetical protein LBP59_15230 [Planctomycetaceae bacterium]|nr:hypothetical protein [Planctomycetaceae bacterium]
MSEDLSVGGVDIVFVLRQFVFYVSLIFVLFFLICGEGFCGGIGDCLWGGSNEETAYTVPYIQSGASLAQVNQPPMNIGAPLPSIPVQATPATRPTLIPQANIPTISPVTGNVGSIGQPATANINTTQPQIKTNSAGIRTIQDDAEIVYVLPSENKTAELCINGQQLQNVAAASVVPAGTPGAIPVAVKNITAYKPKKIYQMQFTPIKQKIETLVNVVDQRTGRIVKKYCQTEEKQITHLPVLHWKEVNTYETVNVKIGEPIKQNYPQNYTPGIQQIQQIQQNQNNTTHKVLYLYQQPEQQTQINNQTFSTEIY